LSISTSVFLITAKNKQLYLIINEFSGIKDEAIAILKIFLFKVIVMKVLCGLLVILAVFGASQGRNAPKFTERKSLRTPFYRRQRIQEPLIVGGNPALIENFPHHLGLLDLSLGGLVIE
jgi:hypothetical protein